MSAIPAAPEPPPGKSRLAALLEHFAQIEDPRDVRRILHPLREVLLLVVCGTIADCDDYDAIADWGEAHVDFLRQHLPYTNGVPGGRWLTILMNRINPALFSAAFTAWVRETWPDRPEFVAIDGKTSRRSHDRAAGQTPLHLVSAFATTSRLVLGQEAVPDKANELTAIPALLARLGEQNGLRGALVSIDTMLDPIDPALFDPLFADLVAELKQCGGLDAMRVLDGHLLIAWDGSEYHCSETISCPNCSHRKRGKNKTEYFHTMLAATVVTPGHNRAVPLEPEFIEPQDGHDKQDCESRAVRRWLAAHGAQYAGFKPVYLGDDLFSRQPICQAVLDEAAHFLFVCKPDSHTAIEEFRAGIKLDELTRKVRRGKQWATYRYQWLCDVPLRGDAKAMTVNWLMIELLDANGEVTYRNSFITDMAVNRENVAELAACGRARWKIENEGFNTLKTKGYHLEHNFGHGQNRLSAVLATLNLLAFACHTACDLGGRAWKAARRELVTRQGFFHSMRALTSYLVFPSWEHLLETLAFTRPPPLGP